MRLQGAGNQYDEHQCRSVRQPSERVQERGVPRLQLRTVREPFISMRRRTRIHRVRLSSRGRLAAFALAPWRAAFLLALTSGLLACNAVLGIGEHDLAETGEPPVDAAKDTPNEAAKADSKGDSPPPLCDEGLNTTQPALGCTQGSGVGWLASPYTPKANLSVERLEVHLMKGSVALLTSVGGTPSKVLFSGPVAAIGATGWAGADVSPPVSIQGGMRYFLAFEGGCSFGVGPAAIEFSASSLDGPWAADGDDVWTARVIGKCDP
jgi:hypothetical protein